MRTPLPIAIFLLALAGCGSGKDSLADRVEQKADNRAERLEQKGREMADPRKREQANSRAAAVRDAGRDQAEAIRQAPLDTNTLSPGEKNKILNAQIPEPPSATGR